MPTTRRAASLAEANPDEFTAITLAADGCIGSAQTLLDARRRKPVMARRESAEQFLSLCASRRGAGEVLAALASLPQKRDEATELFGVIALAHAICWPSSVPRRQGFAFIPAGPPPRKLPINCRCRRFCG